MARELGVLGLRLDPLETEGVQLVKGNAMLAETDSLRWEDNHRVVQAGLTMALQPSIQMRMAHERKNQR